MFYPEYDSILTSFVTSSPKYSRPASAEIVNFLADDPAPPTDPSSGAIKKYFAFDETGNIMVVSTSPDGNVPAAVTEVFQKVSVFFAAITSAMASKNKTLYDYTDLQQVVEGSGLFITMHQEDRTFDYTSRELTLNTAIITQVLGGVAGGGDALQIAQRTIESLGGAITLSVSDTKSDKKVANLLFVCENLMGMPIVSVQLFMVNATETESVAKSNCSTSVTQDIHFKYHQNTYLFVDPTYINKFTDDFKANPEFQKLIAALASKITA